MARDRFVAVGVGDIKLPTSSLLFGEKEEAVIALMIPKKIVFLFLFHCLLELEGDSCSVVYFGLLIL